MHQMLEGIQEAGSLVSVTSIILLFYSILSC